MKQVKLTEKTKKLMGVTSVKGNIAMTEQEQESLSYSLDQWAEYISNVLSTGRASTMFPDGMNELYKVLQSSGRYEPFSAMPEIARLADAVRDAIRRLEDAQSAIFDAAKSAGVTVGQVKSVKSSVKVPRGFPMGSRWFVGLGAGLDHGRRGTVVNIRDYGNKKLKDDEPGRYRDFDPSSEILLMDDEGTLFTMFPNYLEPDVGQTKR